MEIKAIDKSSMPVTREVLTSDLKRIGILPNDILLVHSSLSELGWVCGGAQSVLMSLTEAIGKKGTLVMPAHSGDWSDPTDWQHPPVPKPWIEIIKATMPAYDKHLTQTRGMGRISELFRLQPKVKRSGHPQLSFSARGPKARLITNSKRLFPQLGTDSPLGKLYDLNAKVLLLGVDYDSNTCFHLAETLIPETVFKTNGAAMKIKGKRTWVEFADCDYESDDFVDCGRAFEQTGKVRIQQIGFSQSRLFYIRDAVDFAKDWLTKHRSNQQ